MGLGRNLCDCKNSGGMVLPEVSLPLIGEFAGENGQAHQAKYVDVGNQEEVVRRDEGICPGHDPHQHELQDCKATEIRD